MNAEELVAANSGIWSAAVLSKIALAPLAGLLVTTAGVGIAFALNAASFVVSAAVLRGLRVTQPVAPVAPRRLLAEARQGLALVTSDRLLRALATDNSSRRSRPAEPAPCSSYSQPGTCTYRRVATDS